jgi:hypothetical protein
MHCPGSDDLADNFINVTVIGIDDFSLNVKDDLASSLFVYFLFEHFLHYTHDHLKLILGL